MTASVLAAALGSLVAQQVPRTTTPVANPAPSRTATPTSVTSARERLRLPPLPEAVTELEFGELFEPIGARGLEYTAKAKSLEGKRVRILGYMVKTCRHDHGRFLLTPMPVTLHDHEMGPADDLPPGTVFVDVPPLRRALKLIPHEPGLFLLTGTLSLGGRDEMHGRRSWVRLELERPAADAAPRANDTNAAATVREQVRAVHTLPPEAPAKPAPNPPTNPLRHDERQP